MNDELRNVLEKVARLRALAARAGTQAEAETAAAQADAIIAKYRLVEAEIEAAGAQPSEACELHEEPLDIGEHLSAEWLGILGYGLAQQYGCYIFRIPNRRTWDQSKCEVVTTPARYPVYGRRSDVDLLRYMYAWLKVEILRLSEGERGRADKNAFRHGAVSGFLKALRESTAAQVAQTTSPASAALVLVSRSEDAEKLCRAQNKLGSGRTSGSRGSSEAWARGKQAGVHLHGSQKKIGPGASRALGSGRS